MRPQQGGGPDDGNPEGSGNDHDGNVVAGSLPDAFEHLAAVEEEVVAMADHGGAV